MTTTRPFHPRPTSRRANVYVAILGVSLLVFVIAVGGLAAVNARTRAADALADADDARNYAAAGVEWARWYIASTPKWRTAQSNGQWTTANIGSGTFTVSVTNPNGALNHAETDPVVITSTGSKGVASQIVQVTLNASVKPLTCLSASLTTGGTIVWGSATVQAVSQTVSSSAAMTAAGAQINANAESALTIAGGTYNGTQTPGVTARTLPDSTVFDYYITNGTDIPAASASGGGGVRIRQSLLSPSSNPFGASTNAQGIYVIDCRGLDVDIFDSRIVGTLVLLNTGSGSIIENSVRWTPAVTNYPCLLVKGPMSFQFTTSLLSESSTGSNFNPAGTPYPWPSGLTNATTTDNYSSSIKGLVYVSGNVTARNSPTIDMLVVGGNFASTGTLYLNFNSAYLTTPPPGFYSVAMPVQVGSWVQGTQ